MKYIKYLLILCILCSCRDHVYEDKAIVTGVKASAIPRFKYKVKINADIFDFQLHTNIPYMVGDTVKFSR